MAQADLMGVHDTHSGAQPDQPNEPVMAFVEGRAHLHDVADYEGPGTDVTDLDKAFWITDTAKTAVGLMFIKNTHQSHLLLGASFIVTREGDDMVARLAPPAETQAASEETE